MKKMMKTRSRLVMGFIVAMAFAFAFMFNLRVSNSSENFSNFSKADLSLVALKSAEAACENGSVGPLPSVECTAVWCSSTYSYSGCGSGNGSSCSTRKSC